MTPEKPIKSLTDNELAFEWKYWNNKVKNATSWGAGIAAANEFRKECEKELRLRNIIIKEETDA